MDIINLKDEAILFLDKIFTEIDHKKINLKNWEIDHLCYRSSTKENYHLLKKSFSLFSTLLSEAEINGRPICTFKLDKPIAYKKYLIDLIELPAPKSGKTTEQGFEHFEVVIDQSFDEVIKLYPEANFKKTGMAKSINPELQMTFNSGAIKFHHSSLEHVINIELSRPVIEFLEDSQILKLLATHKPLISGSYPLNINTEKSDLDILFQSNDFSSFKSDVLNIFSNKESFMAQEKLHQNIPSMIVNFQYNDLQIELFCQDKSVYQQQANLHFLIEGRLLKLFPSVKEKIIKLKGEGNKTEPAFGKIFNLDSPYEDLLKLRLKSDQELKNQYQHLC